MLVMKKKNEDVAPPNIIEDAIINTPISPPSQNSDASKKK